jgi:hypothetical protein
MAIDFDDDYEDFDDDDGDLDDDEHHDDDVEDLDEDLDDDEHHDNDEHHDDDEYVPPAPRRSTNPRSLSPVLSARPRSGGLFPCGIVGCPCGAYVGIASYGNTCDSCKHLYDIHSGLTRD